MPKIILALFRNKHWSSILIFFLAIAMYVNMFFHTQMLALRASVIVFFLSFILLFFKLYHAHQENLTKDNYDKKQIFFWVFVLGYGLLSVFFIIQWMLVLSNYLRFMMVIPTLSKIMLPQLILSSLAVVLLVFFFIQAIKKKLILLFNTVIICFFWFSAYLIASGNVFIKTGWKPWLKINLSIPILSSLTIIICMGIYSLVSLSCMKQTKS